MNDAPSMPRLKRLFEHAVEHRVAGLVLEVARPAPRSDRAAPAGARRGAAIRQSASRRRRPPATINGGRRELPSAAARDHRRIAHRRCTRPRTWPSGVSRSSAVDQFRRRLEARVGRFGSRHRWTMRSSAFGNRGVDRARRRRRLCNARQQLRHRVLAAGRAAAARPACRRGSGRTRRCRRADRPSCPAPAPAPCTRACRSPSRPPSACCRAPTERAMPKSMISASPPSGGSPFSIMMFSGLRSRWTTPLSCAAARPCATCCAI